MLVGVASYFLWSGAAASNARRVTPPPQTTPTPGASVSVKVQVPTSMRTGPFDVDRYLTVPPNFSISVYARVASARFMAVAPNGDLLVSRPGAGAVMIVRPSTTGGDPAVSTFVSGLRNPHDIVFHTINSTTYVYITESHQINRYIYNYGDTTAQNRQIIIAGLPDASSPELGGSYGHQLKNIALDSNNKLYLSIASATNASPSDTTSDPVRCAIYQYDADGSNRRLFARGLRNAEGLAMLPGTTDLWVVVNNRDNIAYPFHNDWSGDGTDDYNKVMQSYVDDHPPEEFTRVRDGGNYGWPFVNPNPDTPSGFDNMPFDLDVQNNANGQNGTVDSFDRITKGIQAHSAPLGITFTHNTGFPSLYQPGAIIGYHGSWNRGAPTGYKVVYFPLDTGLPGGQIDLVRGWHNGSSYWGRPVDMAIDSAGNMFISDDNSGTIYKLTYTAPPAPTPPSAPTNLTANASSSSQINLTWSDASSNESGFRIERCQGAGCTNFAEVAQTGANVTTYDNTGLAASTTYRYRVRAFNGVGDSANSNTAEATTQAAAPAAPAAPSNLTAVGALGPSVDLNWTDNSSNESGFRIERCTRSGCADFTQIGEVGPNVRSFSNTGLNARTWYSYRVRAFNANGNSAYSNTASVKTLRR